MVLSFFSKKTDPLEARKRALDSQTRQITSRVEALEQEIAAQAQPVAPSEGPPLWKNEAEASVVKQKNDQPKKIRPLAAQRRRDRNLFLFWGTVLALLILVIVKKWGGAS